MRWLSSDLTVNQINSSPPKSDQHLISPYNITLKSHIKIMRIKELITNDRSSRLLNKFALSAPYKGMNKGNGGGTEENLLSFSSPKFSITQSFLIPHVTLFRRESMGTNKIRPMILSARHFKMASIYE